MKVIGLILMTILTGCTTIRQVECRLECDDCKRVVHECAQHKEKPEYPTMGVPTG